MQAQTHGAEDSPLHILVVDDEEQIRYLWSRILERADGHYEVDLAANGVEAMEKLAHSAYHLVITDIYMGPGPDGYALLKHIKQEHPHVEVLLMTNQPDHDRVVESIRDGAHNYLRKIELTPAKALEEVSRIAQQIRDRLAQIQKLGAQSDSVPERMLSKSRNPKMQSLLQRLPRLARSRETLLLVGETGVGKTSIARLIHNESDRRDKRFLSVNCGAITDNLLQAELFGHAKGAFTGAERRKGHFETTSGGTLFLDEINSTSASVQTALLGVLSDKQTIVRVGESKEIEVDVRVLCATNRDLHQEIEEGKFREDLYYRINTFTVEIPPLRERPEDIEDLAYYFLGRQRRAQPQLEAGGFSPECLEYLLEHPWPGNIRELENAIKYAAQICERDLIEPRHLPPELRHSVTPSYGEFPPPIEDDPEPEPTPLPPEDTDPSIFERRADQPSILTSAPLTPPPAYARDTSPIPQQQIPSPEQQLPSPEQPTGPLEEFAAIVQRAQPQPPPAPPAAPASAGPWAGFPLPTDPEPAETYIHPAIWPEGLTLDNLVDTRLNYKEAMDQALSAVRAAYLRGVVASFDTQAAAAAHANQQPSNFSRLLRTYVREKE